MASLRTSTSNIERVVSGALVAMLAGAAAGQVASIPMGLAPASSASEEHCLPPCACPTGEFEGGMVGRFILTPSQPGPLFDTYRVDQLRATAHLPNWFAPVRITGAGEYMIGGEVALQHRLRLDASWSGGASMEFDSAVVIVAGGPFPAFDIEARTAQFICSRRSMFLAARPICEADFDDGSMTGAPDLAVDIADLLYYLVLFNLGDEAGDMDDGSGTGTRDRAVDISDLLYFLRHFAAGC